MKPINYVFMGLVVFLLISSAIAMSFVGGYTSKTILIIIVSMAVGMVTSGIRQTLFIKEKETDERNVIIANKAKAKAFDVMGIVFGMLIIIYAILKKDLNIVVLIGLAYLLIFIVFMAYFGKYHKEM